MTDTPKHTISTEQLLRFLSHELPSGEAHDVEALLAATPKLRDLVSQLRAMSPGPFAVHDTVDIEGGWRRVDELLESARKRPSYVYAEAQPLSGSVFKRQPLRTESNRGDAMLIGVRDEKATWQHIRHRTTAKQPMARGIVWPILVGLVAGVLLFVIGSTIAHHSSMAGTGAPLTYATGKGQRANITLPDGNTVVLNVASRLDVPTDYNSGNHTVRLTGEAFFTISRNRSTPFTVLAGRTAAKVLGTSFALQSYPTDTTVMLAVREGRVAIGKTVVTARQSAIVNRYGIARVKVTDAAPFAFVTGVLQLDAMRLSDAIPELDRWYDADIRIGDPALANQEIKGGFESGSLSDLSEILTLVLDVKVVRNGRVLTLYSISK